MQAGRPYKDRLFPLGQFNRAIAGFSYSRQPYRAHVYAPLRAGEKQCDRLFPSGQLNRSDRSLIPSKRQSCSLPFEGRVREGSRHGIALLIKFWATR
jgi:hypothetical protein